MTKLQEKLPLVILAGWSSEHFKGIWSHKTEEGSGIVKLDRASEKTSRMEELERGQQAMQEKISQATKMTTNLTKGKGITDGPSLQRKLASLKGGIDPHWAKFGQPLWTRKIKERTIWTVTSRRHAAKVQSHRQEAERDQRWTISKALDLKEWNPIPDVVIPPKFKCQNLKSTMEPNALRTIWPRIITRWWDTPTTKSCWSMLGAFRVDQILKNLSMVTKCVKI